MKRSMGCYFIISDDVRSLGQAFHNGFTVTHAHDIDSALNARHRRRYDVIFIFAGIPIFTVEEATCRVDLNRGGWELPSMIRQSGNLFGGP